ncbi:hypothetical protein NW752_008246 [Fusarium irregulare]|uniref:NACHT domain-containing protein n=1 Tax=Fusarium irregulare TaxID=2494466 RepID=A0A9W8UDY0_9HYPO|nr:hypothetical protein NW752_008246 [Fusarium irregulare]KAJ4019500.1 hypothetical protein NW766_003233 [Fusarium irregulare]
MAEIVGLIASIMGIIKFSADCLTIIESIRDNQHGRTDQVQELEANLGEYVTFNEQLQKLKEKIERTRKLSDIEQSIISTGRDLESTVQDIKDLIKKLSIRPNAQFKFLEVGRSVANHLVFRNDIKDLYKRLETHNQKTREKLKLLLAGDRHTELWTALQNIRQQHMDLEIRETLRFEDIRRKLDVLVDQKSSDLHNFQKQAGALHTATQELEREEQKGSRQIELLKSLYFQELRQRWDNIDDAAGNTLSWLYDPSRTRFTTWLESESSDIYYITGWAGSGKSTLMKHAFDNSRDRLRKWAGPRTLLCANFFFWNQGFAIQKSLEGLLRSLLYQVLRQAPRLIPSVSMTQPDYESWEKRALMDTFQHVLSESESSTRFCFFIDGLDEFEGDEELVARLITTISESPHVKVCVSSRPRPRFDELSPPLSTTKMQDLTRDSMRRYVGEELQTHLHLQNPEANANFHNRLCDEIADRANGVWLWVRLVLRDLMLALKRKENQRKLQSILNDLPKDLNEYFERIILRVNPLYQMEMARTLLLTVFEVQPLPLYAFYLLDEEIGDEDYAIKAAIAEIPPQKVAKVDEEWQVKIHERGRDLLVVNQCQHPIFLDRPVDFLHRTVRDFLKDQYYQKLQEMSRNAKYPRFIPPISLCRIMLFFLKKQPLLKESDNFKDGCNRMIGLVDELLYYARESENHEDCQETENLQVACILDEADAVNTKIFMGADQDSGKHWTNIRDPPANQGLDLYKEGGNNCWIALAIQAGLVKYRENRGRRGNNRRKQGDHCSTMLYARVD